MHPDRLHAWHLYVVRLKLDELRTDRAGIIDELRRANVGASVHFIPVHRHPVYQTLGYKAADFPCAEALYSSVISLPLFPLMSDGDVTDVVAALTEAIRRWSIS